MEFKKAMMAAAETRGGGAAMAGAIAAPVPTGAPLSSSRSPADRLADLDEMKRRGLLGDEEYRAKREALLAEL
jgi:hypothetical protein